VGEEDLEATQFPLTGRSVSRVDILILIPTRCFLPREQDSLSLPLPQDESQPPRTHAGTHVRRPRERERIRARALGQSLSFSFSFSFSRILCVLGWRRERKIFPSSLLLPRMLNFYSFIRLLRVENCSFFNYLNHNVNQ